MKGYIDSLKPAFSPPTYGFISTDDGGNYFFHKSNLKNCTIQQLDEGDVVEFTPDKNERDQDIALEIRKVYQAEKSSTITNPGINPSVDLESFNEDEKRIINNVLKKYFYVTHGGEEFSINKSTYRYCLIKPTEYFNHTFQLSREIVVIFSDYVSFEPRSLDAVSYVYQTISSKLRLDRGCHILICHDDDVEKKLAELLKDNNIDQIVIPFTYRELLGETISDTVIKERFKSYLFDIDLFSTLHPIQNDIFFFGRRDFVHDIVAKCKSNVHSGIFGLRRSGKTSLLYAVQRLLNQQLYPTVFIPCQSDLNDLDWRTALWKVVTNVYSALNMDASNIHEADYQTNDTTIFFEEDMFDCLDSIGRPVTIMFDEIEAITFGVNQGENSKNLWIDGVGFVKFWNTIKGYYTKNPSHLSILVAGTNPMINEVPTIGDDRTPNPMFKQLSESNQGAYLQAFTAEDTKNMVNCLGGYMGLSFDEYSIGKLTSDCGGHPYLTRILCSYINRYARNENISRPVKITRAIYDRAVLDFEKSNDATSFFWMILTILLTSYPKEFNALKILALNGDAVISQVHDVEGLSHLIGYGLIENNQNHYAIKYTTISRFLKGEFRFERQGLSIEEQKEEIQLRINSAEVQLRKLVKNTLLFAYKNSDAKACVITAMNANPATKSDVERAKGLNYAQLFDPSVNKIYFSLLKDIIILNFNAFANVFSEYDEEFVCDKLKVINISRRCPDHSYTDNSENWSWEKFCKFRESISWLESVLADFE